MNQVEWLVKKGQDLSTKNESHAKMRLTKCFWLGSKRTASIELLATNADKAPHRSVDKVYHHYRRDKCFSDLVCSYYIGYLHRRYARGRLE